MISFFHLNTVNIKHQLEHSRPELIMSELIVSTSLAVKYRPKLLSDLVGQDHIVTQINGMLTKRRFPSTILLSGSSGLGKTTTARIIARYVNCKNPGEDFAPCGECVNCTTTENHPDVIEINAADTRGIDDVRSLLQQSKFSPVMGSRRFFIIDEAQQLTVQAQQCFHPDTMVETPEGLVKISTLTEGDEVLSFNHLTGKDEISKVEATSLHNNEKECVRIWVSDTEYFECTEDHPIWVENRGSYLQAKDLLESDELKLPGSIPLIRQPDL